MEPYLMYILLLGAVIFVGATIIPRKQQVSSQHEQTVQNMENALEQFMENMEKDNEELVSLIAKSQHASKVDAEHKEQRLAELERKYSELERMLAQQQLQQPVLRQSAPEPTNPQQPIPASIPAPTPPPAPAESIQSRYADLFQLYEQGKSIEMISKKLGMNKGEVQLVLQLAKQEAAANG